MVFAIPGRVVKKSHCFLGSFRRRVKNGFKMTKKTRKNYKLCDHDDAHFGALQNIDYFTQVQDYDSMESGVGGSGGLRPQPWRKDATENSPSSPSSSSSSFSSSSSSSSASLSSPPSSPSNPPSRDVTAEAGGFFTSPPTLVTIFLLLLGQIL